MIINILWFMFSNIVIEYQEIEYAGPVKHLITVLSFVQLFLTFVYLLGHVHRKAYLAACRAEAAIKENKEQKQEEKAEPQEKKELTGPKQPKPKPPFYIKIW